MYVQYVRIVLLERCASLERIFVKRSLAPDWFSPSRSHEELRDVAVSTSRIETLLRGRLHWRGLLQVDLQTFDCQLAEVYQGLPVVVVTVILHGTLIRELCLPFQTVLLEHHASVVL